MKIKRFNEAITDDVNFYKEIEHYEFIGWDSEHKRKPLTEDDFNKIKKIIGKRKINIDKKVFGSGCLYITDSKDRDIMICQFDDEWYTILKIRKLEIKYYICDGLEGLEMALKSKEINEGVASWIRQKLNQDEKSALNFLEKLDKLSDRDITHTINNDAIDSDNYQFKIDEFDIKCYHSYYPIPSRSIQSPHHYYLEVDDVQLKISQNLSKRIYKKIKNIKERKREMEKKENDDFIRKDFRINFR